MCKSGFEKNSPKWYNYIITFMKGADYLNFIKGQNVIYGGTEICCIGDMVEKDFDGNGSREYIVLSPLELNTTFYVPSEKAYEMLRPMLSKETLIELIKMMKCGTAAPYDKSINFNDAVKKGDYKALISIMQEIYCKKISREKSGKQLIKADRRNFELAKKLIDKEISIAFGIEQDKVEDFISKFQI